MKKAYVAGRKKGNGAGKEKDNGADKAITAGDLENLMEDFSSVIEDELGK